MMTYARKMDCVWISRLLDMTGFSDFSSWSFKNYYRRAHLLIQLSGQLQSFLPNHSVREDADYCNSQESELYLLSSLLQFGTEEQLRITILAVTQTFLFDMHLNWMPK